MVHKCNGCKYKGEHQEMGFKPFGVCYKERNLVEAEKAYNAETCKYKTNAVDLINEITTPFQKVVTAVGDLCAAFAELTAVAAKALTPVVKIIAETYENNKTLILAAGCPNKRVLHLARYGKKARTRKKNINRLKKWLEREEKQ